MRLVNLNLQPAGHHKAEATAALFQATEPSAKQNILGKPQCCAYMESGQLNTWAKQACIQWLKAHSQHRFILQSPPWREKRRQYIGSWAELSLKSEGLGKILLTCIIWQRAPLTFWISLGGINEEQNSPYCCTEPHRSYWEGWHKSLRDLRQNLVTHSMAWMPNWHIHPKEYRLIEGSLLDADQLQFGSQPALQCGAPSLQRPLLTDRISFDTPLPQHASTASLSSLCETGGLGLSKTTL